MDYIIGALIYSAGVLTGFVLVHATLTSKAPKKPPNGKD